MSQGIWGSKYPTKISPKNTQIALPPEQDDIAKIIKRRDSGPSALTASRLAADLDKEKADRKVERFILLSIIGFFIWVSSAIALNNGWLSTLSFVFFIIIVKVLAHACEVIWVTENLQELIDWCLRKKPDPPKEPENS